MAAEHIIIKAVRIIFYIAHQKIAIADLLQSNNIIYKNLFCSYDGKQKQKERETSFLFIAVLLKSLLSPPNLGGKASCAYSLVYILQLLLNNPMAGDPRQVPPY